MLLIWRDVYKSYQGDGERHIFRICLIVITSISISVFGADLSKNSFQNIALIITVLTGFSFSALFSDHSLAGSNLPPPKNETDRHDIEVLKSLGVNFRSRSRLFIILSITDLILIFIVSIGLDVDHNPICSTIAAFSFDDVQKCSSIFAAIKDLISGLFNFTTMVIFFECLYTFYRLSETMMSVVDMRRDYLESRQKSGTAS